MIQSSVIDTESEGSVFLVYIEDRYKCSGAKASNLPLWNILLKVLSEGFVFLRSGLVDGPCGYLCIQASEVDLKI